jgi:hypothetical protein
MSVPRACFRGENSATRTLQVQDCRFLLSLTAIASVIQKKQELEDLLHAYGKVREDLLHRLDSLQTERRHFLLGRDNMVISNYLNQ